MLVKNIIFDLGGVLVDWNPKYVYRQIFQTEEAVNYFLENICTFDWNEQQDGGRTIAEAEQVLIAKFPHYTEEIKAFYGRWPEMLGGPILPTLEVFESLLNTNKYDIYALTNWSAETWPIAVEMYDFLSWFKGVLVSGQENMKKPDPKIFHLICERYNLVAKETLFIDDNANNIKTADELGFKTIHFSSIDKVEELKGFL
jgi:2-haloacid dehalogenase